MSAADDMTLPQDAPSVLGSLQARREEIRKADFLTLPVPRWRDPEVYVRYAPVDHAYIRRVQTAVEKAPKKLQAEAEVNANCDILIRGCQAVFARLDGQEYSLKPNEPNGELTVFDGDLAQNLGLHEGATAREIVKSLFFTDGDIISAGAALGEFSGYRETAADEGLAGE